MRRRNGSGRKINLGIHPSIRGIEVHNLYGDPIINLENNGCLYLVGVCIVEKMAQW